LPAFPPPLFSCLIKLTEKSLSVNKVLLLGQDSAPEEEREEEGKIIKIPDSQLKKINTGSLF
jgi:hypothetical protein